MRTATILLIMTIAASVSSGCEISSLLDRRCTVDTECNTGEICTDAGFCVSEDAFYNLPDGDFPSIDGDKESFSDADSDPDADSHEDSDADEIPADSDTDPDETEQDREENADDEQETEPDQDGCVPPTGNVCFEGGGINGSDIGFKCADNTLQFCRPLEDLVECTLNCNCSNIADCPEACIDSGDGVADCAGTDGDIDGDIDVELEGECNSGEVTCAGWDISDNGFAFVCIDGSWVLQESCKCGPCMVGICTKLCQFEFDHCIDEATQLISDPRPGCCEAYSESCPDGYTCSVADSGCIDIMPDGDSDTTESAECDYPETPVCFAGGGLYGSDMGLKCGIDGALYFCEPGFNAVSCSKNCNCELLDECGDTACVDEGGGAASCYSVDGDIETDGDIEQVCNPGEVECSILGGYTVQQKCNASGSAYVTTICQDMNPCTDDSCTPGVGCAYPHNQAECDDGMICTADDHCWQGICTGDAVICPASPNICKDSVCQEPGGCALVNNTRVCEDGNLCTVNDRCLNGFCRAGAPLICPSDDNVCTQEFCKVDEGCTTSLVSGPCDDQFDCTGGDHCVNGECVGDELECAQPDSQCQAAECVEGSGCVIFNLEGACTDGSACTSGDHCLNGACVPGQALVCPDDGNICTDEYCDPASGCRSTNNTKACNDGLGCTQNDICGGGLCRGTAIVCAEDGNVCTDAACVEGSGCVQNPNTNPCNDGKVCTGNDRCSGGVCSGSAVVCPDDHNTCTTEACVEGVGCQSTPLSGITCNDNNACTSGDICTSGVCGGAAVNCSDGNTCTQDLCNAASGCSNPPVTNGTNCRLTSGGYGECTNGLCIPKIICTPGQLVCESAPGGVTEKTCSNDGTYWEIEQCDDDNSCTNNQCKAGVGCFYQSKDNGSPCSEDGAPGQCINSTCIVEVDGDSDCPAVPSPLDIPDGNTSGLESYIYKDESGLSQRVCVTVDITHPYSGDLEVRLVAPNGQYKILHANEGGAEDDIHKTYKFLDFFFIQSQGIWTLKVIDNAPGDKGTLDCWSLDTSCWY